MTDEPVDKARALQELAEWPLMRDELPALRVARMAAAWRAGHRNLALLARTADVSRNTAYDDLRSVGIDPADARQKEEPSVSITALKAQSARTRLLRHMEKLFADDPGMKGLVNRDRSADLSEAEEDLQWAWAEALIALHGLPRASAVYAEYAKDRQRAEAEKRPPIGSWDNVHGAPPDHWDRDIHGYLCLICGGYQPVLWTNDYGAVCKRCATSGEWDDLTTDNAWPLWRAASHERFLFGGTLGGEMPKGPRTVSFSLDNDLGGEDLTLGEAALLHPECSKLRSLVGLELKSMRAQGEDVSGLNAVAEATVERDGRSFDIIASFTFDPRPEGFEQHPYGFRFIAGRLTGTGTSPATTAEYTDVYDLIGAMLAGLFDTAEDAPPTTATAAAQAAPLPQGDPMKNNTTSVAAHLDGLHHGHFASTTLNAAGERSFNFTPFFGHEPEPELPELPADLRPEDRGLLRDEYRAARLPWAKARLVSVARTAFAEASPVWEAYCTARAEMDSLFAGFYDLDDRRWKSQTLKLSDAHRKAHAAAQDWDRCAHKLRLLDREHSLEVDLAEYETTIDLWWAAGEIGLDLDEWDIRERTAYEGSYRHTLADDVSTAVSEQDRRLAEVARKTGSDD